MRGLYIDLEAVVDVATGVKPTNTPLGYCYDEHNTSFVLFVGTDKGSDQMTRDKNGKLRINVRKNNYQKNQKAQSAGQVAQTQQKLTLKQKLAAQAPVSGEVTASTARDEADFSDVSAELADIPF